MVHPAEGGAKIPRAGSGGRRPSRLHRRLRSGGLLAWRRASRGPVARDQCALRGSDCRRVAGCIRSRLGGGDGRAADGRYVLSQELVCRYRRCAGWIDAQHSEHRQHTGREIPGAFHCRRAKDALHQQLVLRPGRQLHAATVGRCASRRGREGAYREQQDRCQDDVVCGADLLREASRGRRKGLRVSADDDARQNAGGRRHVVGNRVHELRQ